MKTFVFDKRKIAIATLLMLNSLAILWIGQWLPQTSLATTLVQLLGATDFSVALGLVIFSLTRRGDG